MSVSRDKGVKMRGSRGRRVVTVLLAICGVSLLIRWWEEAAIKQWIKEMSPEKGLAERRPRPRLRDLIRMTRDPLAEYDLRADFTRRIHGVTYHINAKGFRSNPGGASIAKANRRVVLIGGSPVFGVGVPACETLPALTQRCLGPEWQVINAALLRANLAVSIRHYVRKCAHLPHSWLFLYANETYADPPGWRQIYFPRKGRGPRKLVSPKHDEISFHFEPYVTEWFTLPIVGHQNALRSLRSLATCGPQHIVVLLDDLYPSCPMTGYCYLLRQLDIKAHSLGFRSVWLTSLNDRFRKNKEGWRALVRDRIDYVPTRYRMEAIADMIATLIHRM